MLAHDASQTVVMAVVCEPGPCTVGCARSGEAFRPLSEMSVPDHVPECEVVTDESW